MRSNGYNRVWLKRFERHWAATVLGWVNSPEELLYWSARMDFPLTDATVFDQWHSDPEIAPYMLLIENGLVAYGEIWLDETEASAELARLVVSPQHRRRGLGRLLIERLACIAHGAGYQQLWVRVFPANAAALGCYESAGFTRVSEEQEVALNAAQGFPFNWMVLRSGGTRSERSHIPDAGHVKSNPSNTT